MPLPPPLTSATVRGTWLTSASGTPLPDDARATLSAVNDVVSPSGAVLLTTQARRGTVAGGTVTWDGVLLSDSPGLAAQVTYRVQVSAPGFNFDHRFVFLTADVVAGVIDLALKAPSTAPPASADYVLAATRGAPGGVATLGLDGLLTAGQRPPGSSSDHGLLTGLGDDDHAQYLTQARGDARYYTQAQVDTGLAARVPLALVDAAGDLLAGSGADALARLARGADWSALRVDPAASPPLRWVAPDAGEVYPLREGWGFHSASVAPGPLTKGSAGFQMWQARVWVPAGEPITKFGVVVGAVATGTSTFAAIAAYSDDGQTLLASTAHDDALFKTLGLRSKAVQVSLAAQPAGRFVRVVATQNYSGGNASVLVTDFGSTDLAFNAGTSNRSAFGSPLTSFPASFDPATGTGLPGWNPTGGTIVLLVG